MPALLAEAVGVATTAVVGIIVGTGVGTLVGVGAGVAVGVGCIFVQPTNSAAQTAAVPARISIFPVSFINIASFDL